MLNIDSWQNSKLSRSFPGQRPASGPFWRTDLYSSLRPTFEQTVWCNWQAWQSKKNQLAQESK